MGLIGLKDDEAGIGALAARRHQQVDRADRAGARQQKRRIESSTVLM
jgi:hypothetical protein